MSSTRCRTAVLALAGCLAASCGDDTSDDDDTRGPARDADAGDARPVQPLDAGFHIDARVEASVPPPIRDASPGDGSSLPGLDASAGGVALRLLSYNVAGLPEGISQSMPSRNSTLISPLLNDYDLTLLQEDFAYHAQLVAMARHPYFSPPDTRGNSLGDGLSFLSTVPFSDFQRDAWTDCFGLLDSGSDCLTPKGFSMARFTVGERSVDIYDVHADAGSAEGDLAARARNFEQLANTIRSRSEGRAVIVAGDFNARYTRVGDTLPALLDTAQLQDVWLTLQRNGERPLPGGVVDCASDDPVAPNLDDPACERIDKVLFRSAGGVTLSPRDYQVEGSKFVDEAGLQLSDHRPVSVVFDITVAP